MSNIIEPKSELNEISSKLAVIVEKVVNTNDKINSLKIDLSNDISVISNKIDSLSDTSSNMNARITIIEKSQNELEDKLIELSVMQQKIETRYITIMNIIKFVIPTLVGLISLASGCVYLFKYLL